MLGGADTGIFQFINKALANPALDIMMPFLTKADSGELVFALAALVIIFGRKERQDP